MPIGPLLFGVVFVGYVAGSELAFRLSEHADLDAVLFVPAGITAGVLLRTPRGTWWWSLAGAGFAELLQDQRSGLGLLPSLGFVAANVVEPLVAAFAVGGFLREPLDLSYRRHVGGFLAFGVGLGPLVGASIGALADRATGGDRLGHTLVQWWLGDALGVLLVGTLILVWGSAPDRLRVTGAWGVLLVAASLAGTTVVVAGTDLPLLFLVLTGVVVAGAQFGVRAVAVTAFAVAAVIAVCLPFESSPILTGMSDGTAIVIIQLKLVVFTTAGLVVAAEVFERVRMTEAASRLQAEAVAEHAIVNRLQSLLLPPVRSGGDCYEAYGSYLAGTGALGVGGDWYDVASLPDGRVFMAVGDVVGRGAKAAAVMARLRAVMLVLAPRAADAGELLEALDEHTDQMIDAFGTTVWAGLYDPRAQRLSYASAGHPPGFLLTPGAGVVRLATQASTPLGVTPDLPKRSQERRVADPATIVLYTDGLVERRGEAIDEGLRRLERSLRRFRGTEPRPQRVVETLRPGEHDDDTVILAVSLHSSRAVRR